MYINNGIFDENEVMIITACKKVVQSFDKVIIGVDRA